MKIALFVLSVMVFSAHQFGVFAHLPLADFADCYLDPLLLMPIILPLRSWELMALGKRKHKLAIKNVLKYTLSVSFIGEVVFPFFSPEFTADIWDVVAYFAGSVLYLALNGIAGKASRKVFAITS